MAAIDKLLGKALRTVKLDIGNLYRAAKQRPLKEEEAMALSRYVKLLNEFQNRELKMLEGLSTEELEKHVERSRRKVARAKATPEPIEGT